MPNQSVIFDAVAGANMTLYAQNVWLIAIKLDHN